MNLTKSVKYGLSPEEIKKRSLAGEDLKVFNMHRTEKTNKLHCRLDRYDVIKYFAKRKKLRHELFVGEKVLVLAKQIKRRQPQTNSTSNLSKTVLISIKTRHLS